MPLPPAFHLVPSPSAAQSLSLHFLEAKSMSSKTLPPVFPPPFRKPELPYEGTPKPVKY